VFAAYGVLHPRPCKHVAFRNRFKSRYIRIRFGFSAEEEEVRQLQQLQRLHTFFADLPFGIRNKTGYT